MAQTTKNAIRKGFLDLLEQRPLDKISVVDIADHCGVNRNTFYYYYCDIYALVREVLETELDRVLNAPPLCTSWYQLMMRAAAFMRANRRAVYHLYQSSQRDLLEREYYQVVYGAVEDLVRRTAEDLPVAADLLETLEVHRDGCVGMAANMIGVNKRIIAFDNQGGYMVMFNPEIVKRAGPYEAEEGCLSLSGTRRARRWESIKVRWQNEKFQERIKTFTGWTAQIIQHEIDHCEGIII